MKPGILVVDDSLTVRMDLAEAFESAGFAPTLCATVASARAALRQGPFVLAVLDVLLPDGDGIDLLVAIKSAPETAGIAVMLLSTEAEVRDRVRGLSTGADEYVGKPYDPAYVVARARELVRASAAAPAAQPSRTVLVVDDSATFRASLQAALEEAGYAVLTAPSGEAGLQLAASARPAAVIVDGLLPGIDGATVIRRMRLDAVLRGTPCLLLTASDDRDQELRALDAGADGFARKEEDVEVILTRLGAILRSAASPSGVEATPSLLGPKRILAVDDSLTYLHELAAHLGPEGYDVILAHSGEEALGLLAVQSVECVLLDLVMPGLSGQETCRRVKGNPAWRDIPLIMLTALEEQQAMIEGINAGADDYITKSGDFEVLKARLRAQLRRKQFEDENRHIREQLVRKEIEAAEGRAARELAETRAVLLTDLRHTNEEIASFSWAVAHDLRAPLRAIDGFARILVEDHAGNLDHDAQHLLALICESAERMARLIDDLLTLSRLGRKNLEFAPVDMTALARSVTEELRRDEPGRAVSVSIGALVPVVGDAGMLRQVLVNLIGNAVKYAGSREDVRIELGSSGEGAEVTYFVRDNGVGFDMRYAAKLFQVFQRLHRCDEFEGTGVGLAIVKRIVERHGGRVWAEGAVNEGATFSFALPSRAPAECAGDGPWRGNG